MGEHWGRHHPPTAKLIKQLSVNETVFASRHATERMVERRISRRSLLEALSNEVRIVQHYREDAKGYSFLVECKCPDGTVYKCVCAIVEEDAYDDATSLTLVIITVWKNGR